LHLFLFDVDSVLVEANGYLKALQDTVAHFSQRMGVGTHPPTESEVRAFEAHGLGSEWDSAPVCIVALLLERLRRAPNLKLPTIWPQALTALACQPQETGHPDYAALAHRIGARMVDLPVAAEAARAVLWQEATSWPELRPYLASLDMLLETLLGRTHDFERAPVTRYFQHLVIGSEGVRETYGVVPDFKSPAYLHEYDRPLLTSSVRERLRTGISRGTIRIALYTARPSLPPADARPAPASQNGYSPEAELAQKLLELDAFPLIGLGRMHWLAQQIGQRGAQLVKPSPVQALAAIGAAWSGQETSALQAALTLHQRGRLCPPLTELNAVTAHIFEDSPSSIEAVRNAVERLQAAGVTITWRPHGIAPPDGPKAQAMAAKGVPTYPSVNEAILTVLD
jgi:hypothetical protein